MEHSGSADGRGNDTKTCWKNTFGSESNVPCGLVSYENQSTVTGVVDATIEDHVDSIQGSGTAKNGKEPIPVAVRSVDVIGVAVDCGLDLTVFQVYENRGNLEKELYYLLPVDESVGLYRFEFRSYCLGVTSGPRSRDGEAFKVLTVRNKDGFFNTSVDHQSDPFPFDPQRNSSYFKVYIGVIPPMDIIQIKLGFVQEISSMHNLVKGEDFTMSLQVPNILFPNYGCMGNVNNRTLSAVQELSFLSNKNQLYAMCEEYPVRFIFRVFQLFACDFLPIPTIMSFTVKDTRGLKMAKEKDIWHPYQIDGISIKSELINGLQISISPSFELKHEARLVAEAHNGHIATVLSYCINLEPRVDSEVIFLLDQSGSMIGKHMNLAKSVLVEMLKLLPSEVRFNVVGFGSNYELFFKQPKTADIETIEQAVSFVESSDATLGYSNLTYVLNSIVNSSTSRKSVILISDGNVDDVHIVRDIMYRFQNQLRIFAVMSGDFSYDGVQILKGFAEITSGIFQSVQSGLDVKRCLKAIIPHLTQPAFRTEKIGWSCTSGSEKFSSLTPDLIIDERKLGVTYGGTQKNFYALFPALQLDSGIVNTESLKASIDFTDIDYLKNLNVKSYESPASYIVGTGATLLFHRLCALRFINLVKEQLTNQVNGDSCNIAPTVLDKMKQLSESLNLMAPFSAMTFFKNTKSVLDAWAQDTRFVTKTYQHESCDGSPLPKSDGTGSKSKRSSRVTAAMPSIKELYAGDYSISCLRDLMVGRSVFVQVNFQAVDGSFDLSKDFSSSLKIDFSYLSQARHRYVSKQSWATMIAFTILTNKLGAWSESEERIQEAISKSSEWLKAHMTEFEISACLHSALKVLWTYFQNEASLQTVETSRKRQSYTRFYR